MFEYCLEWRGVNPHHTLFRLYKQLTVHALQWSEFYSRKFDKVRRVLVLAPSLPRFLLLKTPGTNHNWKQIPSFVVNLLLIVSTGRILETLTHVFFNANKNTGDYELRQRHKQFSQCARVQAASLGVPAGWCHPPCPNPHTVSVSIQADAGKKVPAEIPPVEPPRGLKEKFRAIFSRRSRNEARSTDGGTRKNHRRDEKRAKTRRRRSCCSCWPFRPRGSVEEDEDYELDLANNPVTA